MSLVNLSRPEPRSAPAFRAEPARGVGEQAESRLRSNSYLALKNVSCEYDGGRLILRGCLPTYYLKQIAQEVVAGVTGVTEIVNQINVVKESTFGCRRN
ncbi:MAG TPA: BON domain-containing protein [Gemmataceae bacterium]|nr:BON domain-containing protein [Gemmataceae bacterium]